MTIYHIGKTEVYKYGQPILNWRKLDPNIRKQAFNPLLLSYAKKLKKGKFIEAALVHQQLSFKC